MPKVIASIIKRHPHGRQGLIQENYERIREESVFELREIIVHFKFTIQKEISVNDLEHIS